MVEPPPYLSPSSADAFDGCARRWKFKYIDGLSEPSGEPALIGSFAHRVLELLCGLPARHRSIDQAKQLAKQTWPEFQEDEDFMALELNNDDARNFRWKAWLAIMGLWQLEDPASVEVVSTEEKVRVHLNDVPFVGIVDRLDRIRGDLVVTDYKSGSVPRPRWRDDKLHQVLLYAAAVEANTGEQPQQARLLYLGQKILQTTVTDRRLDKAKQQLSDTWASMQTACETEQFDPSVGPLCGWCPFVEQCDEGMAYVEKRAREGTLQAHAPAAQLVTIAAATSATP